MLEPTAGYRRLPQPTVLTERLRGGFRRWRKEFMVGDLFAGERLQRCQKALLMGEFPYGLQPLDRLYAGYMVTELQRCNGPTSSRESPYINRRSVKLCAEVNVEAFDCERFAKN